MAINVRLRQKPKEIEKKMKKMFFFSKEMLADKMNNALYSKCRKNVLIYFLKSIR